MTAGQLLIAWVLAKQPAFVPVVGAKTARAARRTRWALWRSRSRRATSARSRRSSRRDAVAGDRYAKEQMRHLDSEK